MDRATEEELLLQVDASCEREASQFVDTKGDVNHPRNGQFRVEVGASGESLGVTSSEPSGSSWPWVGAAHPRRLDAVVQPDAEKDVEYTLADARTFEGHRVLVVGLGDSAMEAAIAHTRRPSRQRDHGPSGLRLLRGKKRNIDELQALVRRGKIELELGRVVRSVERSAEAVEVSSRVQRGGRIDLRLAVQTVSML